MASKAHCAYCFDVLAAQFERRQPLSLSQVERLWLEYTKDNVDDRGDGEEEDDEDEEEEQTSHNDDEATVRPQAISRLLHHASPRQSASSSSSSLPSTRSNSSRNTESRSGTDTPASSSSSLFSSAGHRSGAAGGEQKFPLFVTWNTVSRTSGHKTLRGCIGTFEPLALEEGLRCYALTSALEDTRFSPISASILPSLSAHVTLLTNFSSPTSDPLDWTLGVNGIRISFTYRGRRCGATYLPDVPKEQGWTQVETIVSLMRKAGWAGRETEWEKTWRDGKGELVTYEGKQIGLDYEFWKAWRLWVDKRGVKGV